MVFGCNYGKGNDDDLIQSQSSIENSVQESMDNNKVAENINSKNSSTDQTKSSSSNKNNENPMIQKVAESLRKKIEIKKKEMESSKKIESNSSVSSSNQNIEKRSSNGSNSLKEKSENTKKEIASEKTNNQKKSDSIDSLSNPSKKTSNNSMKNVEKASTQKIENTKKNMESKKIESNDQSPVTTTALIAGAGAIVGTGTAIMTDKDDKTKKISPKIETDVIKNYQVNKKAEMKTDKIVKINQEELEMLRTKQNNNLKKIISTDQDSYTKNYNEQQTINGNLFNSSIDQKKKVNVSTTKDNEVNINTTYNQEQKKATKTNTFDYSKNPKQEINFSKNQDDDMLNIFEKRMKEKNDSMLSNREKPNNIFNKKPEFINTSQEKVNNTILEDEINNQLQKQKNLINNNTQQPISALDPTIDSFSQTSESDDSQE